MYRTLTRQLIDFMDGGKSNPETALELKPLTELASKNKVLLQLLITLDIKKLLREHQREAMRRIVQINNYPEEVLNSLSIRDYSSWA